MNYEGRSVKIHTAADAEGMRCAGKLAADTLDMIAPYVVPGVSTERLNSLCHDFIMDHGATPAPLGYRGFPKSVCTSVNHVVCHGIPDPKKVLQEGDVINIDVTTIVDGWHGDTSRMYAVGAIAVKAKKLINVTFDAMWAGIKVVRPGATTGDIGHAIQVYAQQHRYSVVEEFCGHGLGRVFHDAPNILHFGTPRTGTPLRAGMFFTIEPMINAGKAAVRILADGWTAVTRDKSLSAQFEHSLQVTQDGYEVFTLSATGLHNPVEDKP